MVSITSAEEREEARITHMVMGLQVMPTTKALLVAQRNVLGWQRKGCGPQAANHACGILTGQLDCRMCSVISEHRKGSLVLSTLNILFFFSFFFSHKDLSCSLCF